MIPTHASHRKGKCNDNEDCMEKNGLNELYRGIKRCYKDRN